MKELKTITASFMQELDSKVDKEMLLMHSELFKTMEEFAEELLKSTTSQRAAKRARVKSVSLSKLMKEFRSMSLERRTKQSR